MSTQKNQNLGGFAIYPKLDCPHLKQDKVGELLEFLLDKNSQHFSEFECHQCKDTNQNWMCLECQTLGCSRYVKGHMAEHNNSTKHPIALSFSDASFWCYDCQSYIDDPNLKKARLQLSSSKFAKDPTKLKQQAAPKKEQKQEDISKQLQKLGIEDKQEQKKSYTYQKLIDGLKNKKYKKVIVLTGAGISVASGIPDFRTPGTGLYSQLQKYNLPFPQAVFEISFFKKNPEPFTRLAKQFFAAQDYKPTLAHKFIKKLQDQGLLQMNLTQNIDDLQTKAGLSTKKLLQAHGHARQAHCIVCHEQANIQKWRQNTQKLQPTKCESCQGLVKPDIVFFGQQLPKQFYDAPQLVQNADLVIISGTSLVVAPFSYLGTMIKRDCPIVLVNNEDSLKYRDDKLWLKGDIQQNFQKIMKDLNWN